MAGTKAGGAKLKETIRKRHGENYWAEIGRKGGSVKVAKGFACNRELARQVGGIGGKISKRGKAKKENLENEIQ